MPSIATQEMKRPRYLIHQPVCRQHADDEDDGEEVDYPADGRLNLQGEVAFVHADMHAAGLAGNDARRHLRKVSEAGEGAIIDILPVLVVGSDLVRHAGNEGMSDDGSLSVHHENIRDAWDVNVLVDDGLQGRIVLVDDQVAVRVGNCARDRSAAVQEIVGELPVDGMDVNDGSRHQDEPHEGKDAKQGLLIEPSDPHRFTQASHSPSCKGTNWPLRITE